MTHEQKIENIIIELGLTAPRITPEMIDELMGQVTYSTSVISGTTTTLATAIDAAGFTLCTISSACASPENFNPALGIEIAITKARAAAREKLYELEGYRLKRALHDARLNSSTKALEQIRTVLAMSKAANPDAYSHGGVQTCSAGSHTHSVSLEPSRPPRQISPAPEAIGHRCSAACNCSRHRPA